MPLTLGGYQPPSKFNTTFSAFLVAVATTCVGTKQRKTTMHDSQPGRQCAVEAAVGRVATPSSRREQVREVDAAWLKFGSSAKPAISSARS